MKFYFILFTSLLITSCWVDDTKKEVSLQGRIKENEIIAKGKTGYTLPGLDHGLVQSPINILSFAIGHSGKHSKHTITTHFEDKINAVENTGHSVQLDFAPGSTIAVDNETFDFKQMHFHTPSEHLIDGITYPMELHIVNTMQNQSPEETTEYLVIGVLFKMGKEDNKFIEEFINSIPEKAHSKKEIKTGKVKLDDLLHNVSQDKLDKFYHYKGSLTTPPNTESVRWYVYKHIFTASPRQIQRINELEGNNARHVQALHGREVVTN